MLNIENKVITITGASSGIGEASARLLAQNGATVVLGARRTQKLEKIVGEIRAAGGTAEFKAVDVSNREDMKAFIHFARDKFGRVDVIFNNAGVMPLSPMNALKVEEWDRTINVNIYGVLALLLVCRSWKHKAAVSLSTPHPSARMWWDLTAQSILPQNLRFGLSPKDCGRNRKISASPHYAPVWLRVNLAQI